MSQISTNMKVEYFDAVVVDIQDESPAVKRFYFKMPAIMEFRFKAGQFVMLDLPIEAKFTNRSYSIASAPSTDNIFELCIVLKEDGVGTPYLWQNIRVGSIVKCSAPLGKFTLPETIETPLCFIGTGTGIAPLRSMIYDIYNRGVTHQEMYLVFGNRLVQDVLYRKEFEELAAQHPEFKFLPVLSRETPNTWQGLNGYVHPIYMDIIGGQKVPMVFYLCGWSNMVREARDKLRELGYDKTNLKFELYD